MCVEDDLAVGGIHRNKICCGDCGYSDDVTDTVLINIHHPPPSLKIIYDSLKGGRKMRQKKEKPSVDGRRYPSVLISSMISQMYVPLSGNACH